MSTLVPMPVEWTPAWLTWVGATTACLRALGLTCDLAAVAGMTGYAFHLCIRKGVCPSGPTAFPWSSLQHGVAYLGRTAQVFEAVSWETPRESAVARAQHRYAFEVATAEVQAGRACVIWGAYLPEFAAVYGVTEDSYLVKSFRGGMGQDEPPVRWDELNSPSGAYVLTFPTAADISQASADHCALSAAVARFRYSAPIPDGAYGVEAYDFWIAELEGGRADAGGNAYNAQCFAEGRQFARDFLQRVADRNPAIGDVLGEAAEDYTAAAAAMARVAELFPFCGQWGKPVDDRAAITAAVAALREAQDAECRAINHVAEVARKECKS